MALVEPACFLGLSQEDRRAQIYEALGGTSECFYEATVLEQQKLILLAIGSDACIETTDGFYRAWAAALGATCVEDEEDALNQIYSFYYTDAGDDTLTDPDCFPSLMPDQKLAAIFATLGEVPPVSSYDPDAEAYFVRVVAEGSDLSDPTKEAVNNFVVAAKVGEYWDKLKRVNLFCGADLIAALVPLKVETGGQNTDTAVNFVGGDYSEETGITGDGATKHLDTGFNPATSLTAESAHFGRYNRSATAVSGSDGCTGGGGSFAQFAPYGDGTFYSDIYDTGSGRVSGPTSAPFGFLLASRESAASHIIYQNGAAVASSSSTGGTAPSLPIYIFASNISFADPPGASQWHSYNYAAYTIGDGLTEEEVELFNVDMQIFQAALGRGVA